MESKIFVIILLSICNVLMLTGCGIYYGNPLEPIIRLFRNDKSHDNNKGDEDKDGT